MWICGYVDMWICGYVDMWICEYVNIVWCENTGLVVCSDVVWCRLLVFLTSNCRHHLASLKQNAGQSRKPFLMVLHLYWSRPAQCLLVAHHGYWVPCSSMLNCAGSRSRLEPQRYSVHDPSARGYALALTNPITCCLAGRCLQAKAGRRE